MAQADSGTEATRLLANLLDRCHAGIPGTSYEAFTGPIELKQCPKKGYGRGLFLTKDVKPGELLFCEQAFSAVFLPNDVNGPDAITSGGSALDSNNLSVDEIRYALSSECYRKLQETPSLAPAFMDLDAGTYCPPVHADGEEAPSLDPTHVRHVVFWNCFDFPTSSRDNHYLVTHDPARSLCDRNSLGLWILASYMNHTCVPNTQRSFVGDLMIVRAGSDLKAGTELRHTYVDLSKSYQERQNELSGYGFQCECSLCSAWVNTSHKKRKRRKKIAQSILDLILGDVRTPLDVFDTMLDSLEATYVHPAAKEPRLEMRPFLTKLIESCSLQGRPWDVYTLVDRYLDVQGFKLKASPVMFQVKEWGYVDDFVVLALAALWKAHGSSGPRVCADIEEVVKTAYKMVVGETDSFEAAYGRERPDFTNWSPHTKLEDYVPDSIFRTWTHVQVFDDAYLGFA